MLTFVTRWMAYHRRTLSSLLLGLCLLTAFLVLEPLYVGQILESRAAQIIDETRSEILDITVSSPEPVTTDLMAVLNRELGTIARTIRQYNRAVGPSPLPANAMLCGYDYVAGEPITAATRFAATPSDHCYTIFSFGAVEELFTVVEGRWPENISSPAASTENVPIIMGDAQVEAVLTTTAANGAGIHLGEMLAVGNQPDRTIIVHVVGLVEPVLDSTNPFWNSKGLVLTGAQRPFGSMEYRFDMGLIVTGTAFVEWIHPIAERNDYVWWVEVNPDRLDAAQLAGINDRLFRLESQLRLENPDIEILTGMKPLITAFAEEVTGTERPARWLAGIAAVLMLFMLTTLSGMVLERQRAEWALMTHRGANHWHFIAGHTLMMTLLGLLAGIIGLLLAWGLLAVAQRSGLLELDGGSLAKAILSKDVLLTDCAAVILGIIALSLPGWFVARRSPIKARVQGIPPHQTLVERYYLDVVLVCVGAVLTFRLHSLGVGNLEDPFSLAGPVLLLSGLAVIWLRIFRLCARLAEKLLAAFSDQTALFALRQVARDSTPYASFALMVMGTVILGATAVTLRTTQDTSAWETARQQVGAEASAVSDPSDDIFNIDWRALPDVTGVHQLLILDGNWNTAVQPLTLIGIDPVTMAEHLPEHQAMLAALDSAAPPVGGLPLPEDTQAITIQIYSVASTDGVTRVIPELQLVNNVGVPESVPMSADDASASGRFETFTGTLPDGGDGQTWRLTGLRLSSENEQSDFIHTIYIDNVAAVDSQGQVVMLADFESNDASEWLPDSIQATDALTVSRSTQQAVDGGSSLEITYRIRNVQFTEIHPLLMVNPAPNVPLPVVISPTLAEEINTRTNNGEIVGVKGVFDLTLPLGIIPLSYEVMGVIPAFPGAGTDARFVVAPIDPLLYRLNANRSPSSFYDVNRLWLALSDHQPDEAFKAAITATLPGQEVTYAWDTYETLQAAPLAKVTGVILYAGFGAVLILCLVESAYYFAALFRRSRMTMGILRAMGWDDRQVWAMVAAEQIIMLPPALAMGVILGIVLTDLLVPFLIPIPDVSLTVPFATSLGLLVGILALLAITLAVTAAGPRRMAVAQMTRLEDE